jgi:hypothetical protein
MSWQNAPVLRKLTATQQGGNRGAQLWGVDIKGKLYTIYQKTPGGEWSNWMSIDWAPMNHPKYIYELAACQLGDGRVKLWVTDLKQELWTTEQQQAGGDWMNWYHSTNTRWNNAPELFKKLTAVHMGKSSMNGESAMFIGLKDDGNAAVCFGGSPKWTRFRDNWHGAMDFMEITACQQGGKGHVAVFGLDRRGQLFGTFEEESGTGNFGDWVGPHWGGAPPLRNIAAVQGSHGAVIVGQDMNYHVVANFQSAPNSTNWSGWSQPNLANAPQSYELTAAGQNNGKAQIWAVTLKQNLTSIAELDGGRWPDRWSDYDKD